MNGLSSVLGRIAAVALLIAGVTQATEEWTESVPGGDGFVVVATVEPGVEGAEVSGKGDGQGHVNFRVNFGADLQLSVNGLPGAGFDPMATYSVVVECANVGGQWLATTRVMNVTAGGIVVCEQIGHPIAGGAGYVRAAAATGQQLDVQ